MPGAFSISAAALEVFFHQLFIPLLPPYPVSTSSQLGAVLPPTGHLAMSGNIFLCHNWGNGVYATGSWWVEARGAAKHFTMHSTAPDSKK